MAMSKSDQHQVWAWNILVHVLCLAVYLIPLYTHPYEGTAVLDELHIVSHENHDILGDNSWTQVFVNDYWGRPMTSESSHKSWRPLTVLTFRWIQGLSRNLLQNHRLFNIFTHAATGHVVAIVATLLFPSPQENWMLFFVTKITFCFHPTHVEVTANAANRPHLLAVLCSCLLVDPRIHILLVLLFQTAGLLSSETFIFQTPAILVTMTVIAYRQKQQPETKEKQSTTTTSSAATFGNCLLELSPRYVLIVILTFGYLLGRHLFGTLSIPDGLIRPAENPFYDFVGLQRVRNYSHVLSIHVFKSLTLDFVGFSHEYGYGCLRELESWTDARLLIPLGIVAVIGIVSYWAILKRGFLSSASLLWLVYLSWLATLFPISGIVKVGTFVADRIVVASTVSFSILVGRFVSSWIVAEPKKGHNKSRRKAIVFPTLDTGKTVVVMVVWAYMWQRVHFRSMEWMDSVPLLHSSLRTCPNNAKSNMELSKVYSGLYPELLNITYSRQLLEKAEEIDSNYCDIHQQFAHVAIQELNYLEFEERLFHAILCPYTMTGSVELWRRYWQATLAASDGDSSTALAAAQIRHDKYSRQIQEAVEKERMKEMMKHGE